jgi:hypothetical protein
VSNEADACLSLGLPATICHTIDSHSPLHDLSIETMAKRKMEVIVLLDATDAMTSCTVEARHAYQASDIALVGDEAQTIIRRLPDGMVTVDYSCFYERAVGAVTLEDALACSQGVRSRNATPREDIASASCRAVEAAAGHGQASGVSGVAPQAEALEPPRRGPLSSGTNAWQGAWESLRENRARVHVRGSRARSAGAPFYSVS